jgi:MFS family permease
MKSGLPKGAWLVVGLLSVVGCLNYLDRIMITTMRESIVTAIPMTEAQFGMLTSVFLWVYGLLSPIAGFLADRFNRSRVIIASLFLWSIVTFMTAYSTTFEELLTTRILMGVSEACYIPAALALIVDYHRKNTRSLAVGIHMVGIMFGSGLGFIGGWVAEHHHWNTPFIYLGIIGIIYSLLLIFTLRDVPPAKASSSSISALKPKLHFYQSLKDLFELRSYNLMLISWGLLAIVTWLVVGWLPTYFQVNFKLSQGVAGLYATGYFYLAELLGLLFGGYWADRWSKTNSRARILVPVIGICIGAPCVIAASSTGYILLAVTGFVIYAFTAAFINTNMMPMLCLITSPDHRATGYGILNLAACIIGGGGLYAGGVLRDAQVNLSNAFRVGALIMLVSAAMLFLVKPRVAIEEE